MNQTPTGNNFAQNGNQQAVDTTVQSPYSFVTNPTAIGNLQNVDWLTVFRKPSSLSAATKSQIDNASRARLIDAPYSNDSSFDLTKILTLKIKGSDFTALEELLDSRIFEAEINQKIHQKLRRTFESSFPELVAEIDQNISDEIQTAKNKAQAILQYNTDFNSIYNDFVLENTANNSVTKKFNFLTEYNIENILEMSRTQRIVELLRYLKFYSENGFPSRWKRSKEVPDNRFSHFSAADVSVAGSTTMLKNINGLYGYGDSGRSFCLKQVNEGINNFHIINGPNPNTTESLDIAGPLHDADNASSLGQVAYACMLIIQSLRKSVGIARLENTTLGTRFSVTSPDPLRNIVHQKFSEDFGDIRAIAGFTSEVSNINKYLLVASNDQGVVIDSLDGQPKSCFLLETSERGLSDGLVPYSQDAESAGPYGNSMPLTKTVLGFRASPLENNLGIAEDHLSGLLEDVDKNKEYCQKYFSTDKNEDFFSSIGVFSKIAEKTAAFAEQGASTTGRNQIGATSILLNPGMYKTTTLSVNQITSLVRSKIAIKLLDKCANEGYESVSKSYYLRRGLVSGTDFCDAMNSSMLNGLREFDVDRIANLKNHIINNCFASRQYLHLRSPAFNGPLMLINAMFPPPPPGSSNVEQLQHFESKLFYKFAGANFYQNGTPKRNFIKYMGAKNAIPRAVTPTGRNSTFLQESFEISSFTLGSAFDLIFNDESSFIDMIANFYLELEDSIFSVSTENADHGNVFDPNSGTFRATNLSTNDLINHLCAMFIQLTKGLLQIGSVSGTKGDHHDESNHDRQLFSRNLYRRSGIQEDRRQRASTAGSRLENIKQLFDPAYGFHAIIRGKTLAGGQEIGQAGLLKTSQFQRAASLAGVGGGGTNSMGSITEEFARFNDNQHNGVFADNDSPAARRAPPQGVLDFAYFCFNELKIQFAVNVDNLEAQKFLLDLIVSNFSDRSMIENFDTQARKLAGTIYESDTPLRPLNPDGTEIYHENRPAYPDNALPGRSPGFETRITGGIALKARKYPINQFMTTEKLYNLYKEMSFSDNYPIHVFDLIQEEVQDVQNKVFAFKTLGNLVNPNSETDMGPIASAVRNENYLNYIKDASVYKPQELQNRISKIEKFIANDYSGVEPCLIRQVKNYVVHRGNQLRNNQYAHRGNKDYTIHVLGLAQGKFADLVSSSGYGGLITGLPDMILANLSLQTTPLFFYKELSRKHETHTKLIRIEVDEESLLNKLREIDAANELLEQPQQIAISSLVDHVKFVMPNGRKISGNRNDINVENISNVTLDLAAPESIIEDYFYKKFIEIVTGFELNAYSLSNLNHKHRSKKIIQLLKEACSVYGLPAEQVDTVFLETPNGIEINNLINLKELLSAGPSVLSDEVLTLSALAYSSKFAYEGMIEKLVTIPGRFDDIFICTKFGENELFDTTNYFRRAFDDQPEDGDPESIANMTNIQKQNSRREIAEAVASQAAVQYISTEFKFEIEGAS